MLRTLFVYTRKTPGPLRELDCRLYEQSGDGEISLICNAIFIGTVLIVFRKRANIKRAQPALVAAGKHI